MKIISTSNAPKPGGHYSQAVVYDGLVYVSGILPVHPEIHEKETGSIVDQTRLVLHNLSAILEAAGSDLNHVIKTTIYVSDIDLWGDVNQVYAQVFGDHRPARAVVPVPILHHGFKIEIEAVAAVRG